LELLGGTTGLQYRPTQIERREGENEGRGKLEPLGHQNRPKRREKRSVGMRRRKLVLGCVAGPTRVEEKESERRRE